MLLAMVVALLAPSVASASSGQLSILQDDREFLGDLGEDPAAALREAKALGVDVIRVNVIFNRIYKSPRQRTKPSGFDTSNPSSSQYAWGEVDRVVNLTRANGMKLLLTVTGPGPFWSTERPKSCRRNPCALRPNPKAFGQFAAAVARRYKGKVSLYSIYNEPNLAKTWLTPRYGKRTKQGRVETAAAIYRKLFIAGQKAIARYDRARRNKVLFGEVAAINRPLPFLNAALCLDTNGRPFRGRLKKLQGCSKAKRLNIGGFAIHPYNQGGNGSPRTRSKTSTSLPIAHVNRLHRLADTARRRKRINNKSVYITEFGFQTNPPDRISKIKPRQQAQYLNESDRLFFGDRRIKAVAQYELVDVKETGQFNSGLRFVRRNGKGGKQKPSYGAYRVPLVVTRRSSRSVEVWGQVRPGGRTTATIQILSKGRFKTVKRVRTNGRGYFRTNVSRKNASRQSWRVSATYGGDEIVSRVARAGKRLRYYSR